MSDDDNKKLAEDLLKAVNEAAGSARGMFITLMVLTLYVFIVVAGTDDLALLRNSTVAVPTLSNATLPARGFFMMAPWVYVFMHLDVLIHFKLLADKLRRFNEVLALLNDDQVRQDLRVRLAGFPFANWLGSDPSTGRIAHGLQGLIVWASMVLIPLLLLLDVQLGFLAYQSEAITWGQRSTIILDVAFLTYFWPLLVRGRLPSPRPQAHRFAAVTAHLPTRVRALSRQLTRRFKAPLVVLLPGVCALFLSILVATIPNEGADYWLRNVLGSLNQKDMTYEFERLKQESCQKLQGLNSSSPFCGKTEEIKPRQYSCADWIITWPFGPGSGNSVLAQQELLSFLRDINHVPKHMEASCPTLALFHIKGTPFRRTLSVTNQVLAKSELKPEWIKDIRATGRQLREGKGTLSPENQEKYQAAIEQIQGLDLSERSLRWANLSGSSLPGATLVRTHLAYATLKNADLRQVHADEVRMENAVGSMALLSGAQLNRATLTGMNLKFATLTGASLNSATLTGARLDSATLTGSNLSSATLTGAYLNRATLTGANLNFTTLTGASLDLATLTGARLLKTRLRGAQGSNLKSQAVFIDLNPAQHLGAMTKADLEQAQKQLQGLDTDSAKKALERLSQRLGQPAQGFDFSECVGGEGCATPPEKQQQTAQKRAALLADLICPQTGKAEPALATRLTNTLQDEANTRFNFPPLIHQAAQQTLADLKKRGCLKE